MTREHALAKALLIKETEKTSEGINKGKTDEEKVETENAFNILKKKIIENPHTTKEVLDSLMIIFKGINESKMKGEKS